MIYFAWVNAADTAFLDRYARHDEEVLTVSISQVEAEFPTATVEIRNPRLGLLAASRRQWVWLSEDSTDTPGAFTPLFFGRVIGIPTELQADAITVEFLARPRDWDAQRAALAATLKVLPYYDPIWLDQAGRESPDTALEGYPRLWHTDRVTHVVTASDVLLGEDGTLNVGGGFMRDSLSIQYGPIPGRRVAVKASVQWEQQAFGTVNLYKPLVSAFHTIGGSPFYQPRSFTGQGLISGWPKKGDSIGAGWTVGESKAVRVDGLISPGGNEEIIDQTGHEDQLPFMPLRHKVHYPLWTIMPTFKVDYLASRSRKESVSFMLETDCQALLTDPGDAEALTIDLQSAELDQPIDAGGAMPIGELGRRTYFQTPRGWNSIANLIARARAQLLLRSRAVNISFDIPWEVGATLSCRQNIYIEDDRLPGGSAAGKIISYALNISGDQGIKICTVTIGCTIGHGATVTEGPGTPTYVADADVDSTAVEAAETDTDARDDGYVADGYQARTGRIVMPIAGQVTFTPPEGIAIADDGVDFNNMRPDNVLLPILGTHTEPDEPGIDIIFGESAQRAIIKAGKTDNIGGSDIAAVTAALNVAFTSVRVNLVPLTVGPFEQSYPVTVSGLMCPKTIDLEIGNGVDTGTGT